MNIAFLSPLNSVLFKPYLFRYYLTNKTIINIGKCSFACSLSDRWVIYLQPIKSDLYLNNAVSLRVSAYL